MPGTVDDFVRRFGGAGTVSDQDATALHERFVSDRPEDQEFDANTYHQSATEYLGKLDESQFQTAASNAYRQAPPQEKQGMISSLLGALGLGGGGATSTGLMGMLGLKTNDPRQMDEADYARLLNYARREKPEAVQQTVKEKPWFLKAMGNPIVLGALSIAAAKLVKRQSAGRGIL